MQYHYYYYFYICALYNPHTPIHIQLLNIPKKIKNIEKGKQSNKYVLILSAAAIYFFTCFLVFPLLYCGCCQSKLTLSVASWLRTFDPPFTKSLLKYFKWGCSFVCWLIWKLNLICVLPIFLNIFFFVFMQQIQGIKEGLQNPTVKKYESNVKKVGWVFRTL